MKLRHWALLVGAFLATGGCGGSGGSGDSAPGPVPLEAVYNVWTAFIPDATAADVARADLIASKGVPGSLWTGVDGGLTTKVFDPVLAPTTINAILIQVSALENYSLDSVEILDDQDRIVEHASGTVWSNLVILPDGMLGAPDGVGALTTAVEGANAFIFTRFVAPIEKFRINAIGDTKLPVGGDVLATGSFTSNSIERPGGLAVDVNGVVHLTLTVNNTIHLARFGLDGVMIDEIAFTGGVTATAGSHSVALDQDGWIFTAATEADGDVVVRRHDPADLSEDWNVDFASGLGGDRVEANGLAVDAEGNLVVAGGMSALTSGINHWLAKVNGDTGAVLFSKSSSLDAGLTTYWRGVTTEGTGVHIYATGDLASEVLVLIQALTARFGSTGIADWNDGLSGEDALPDAGNAVAVDGAGNLLVAGFVGSATQGRNSFLLKYGTTGVLTKLTSFNGLANGNDEILDIAVDADGSIYAVGYETVAGQGENMWVRKYDSEFTPIWTRTYHGGFGNDRAISVAIHEDRIVVAGYQTVSGGKTKLMLRMYAK